MLKTSQISSVITTNSNTFETKLLWFWYFILILVIGNLILFLTHLLQMPEDHLVQFIYDDGYYYLVLAKNFFHFRYWTFDSGATVTSGFQPLFAYLLVALYALFKPNNLQFIHIALCLTVTITLLPFIWLIILRPPHKWALIAACALITSTLNFSYNTITLVEWPLVILLSSSYIAYLYHLNINQPLWRPALLLALIAFFGSLTRADFGGLALVFFCAAILLYLVTRERRYVFLTFMGLAGATIGVVIVFLHNYLFTGHILQSSAIMKLNWSQITAPTPYAFYVQIMSLFMNSFNQDGLIIMNPNIVRLVPILLLIALNIFAYKGVCAIVNKNAQKTLLLSQVTNSLRDKKILVIAGSLITVIFYCAFYAFNTGALQPWYTGIIIAPIIILITGLLALIHSRLSKMLISLIIAILVVLHIHLLYTGKIIPWESQKSLYEAGIYLQQHPLKQRIGSWNAGIVSYYEGNHIINLDGLMNDEILPYVKADHLECYILRKQIAYIVDTQNMFNDYHKQRGGYTNNLENWVMPQVSIDQNAVIYKVNLEGLSKDNQCVNK